MNPFDLLNTGLLDLLYELRDANMPLVIGGGYGLYLKQNYVRANQLRTLFDLYPQSRSTNDIDVFLQTEILADRPTEMQEALERAGYFVVEKREYWQFAKSFPDAALFAAAPHVKLDLLTPPPPDEYIEQKRVRIDIGRRVLRVKPGRGGILLHAHLAIEALGMETGLIAVPVHGSRSTGEQYEASVLLPHPFTYLIMKLAAFHDREFKRDDSPQAMKHAFDLYPVVAMMTADEYKLAQQLGKIYQGDATFKSAADIVNQQFSHLEARGMLRMREHPDFFDGMDLKEFMAVLAEVFMPQQGNVKR